mmetsp:Transcript_22262/g.88363  ORF Transcript_22262/g.88363 Transcript_22262/m.88363 type:complete len:94 (-) Transcript_22262:1403-1684(-)
MVMTTTFVTFIMLITHSLALDTLPMRLGCQLIQAHTFQHLAHLEYASHRRDRAIAKPDKRTTMAATGEDNDDGSTSKLLIDDSSTPSRCCSTQ